jgi:hypothetical protein
MLYSRESQDDFEVERMWNEADVTCSRFCLEGFEDEYKKPVTRVDCGFVSNTEQRCQSAAVFVPSLDNYFPLSKFFYMVLVP